MAHKQMIKGERNEGNQNYYKMQPLVQVMNLKEVAYTKECYLQSAASVMMMEGLVGPMLLNSLYSSGSQSFSFAFNYLAKQATHAFHSIIPEVTKRSRNYIFMS